MELRIEELHSIEAWEKACRQSQRWASTARREAEGRARRKRTILTFLLPFDIALVLVAVFVVIRTTLDILHSVL